MGMFDYIHAKIKCPKCNAEFEAEDQIKWTNDCFLKTYQVGERIDAQDGEYTYGSLVRPNMTDYCPNCHTKVSFKAIVKNGILDNVESTSFHDTKHTEKLKSESAKAD